MRRRALFVAHKRDVCGNTSACAEKRDDARDIDDSHRKYLRVCGEEHDHSIIPPAIMEIPPRVRRRAGGVLSLVALWGNTSACAEKRNMRANCWHRCRKYLRVRGEETLPPLMAPLPAEIPPRARRKVEGWKRAARPGGNTSACAEKSPVVARQRRQEWKYLRVRGEESTRASPNHAVPEIPPRARRREPVVH